MLKFCRDSLLFDDIKGASAPFLLGYIVIEVLGKKYYSCDIIMNESFLLLLKIQSSVSLKFSFLILYLQIESFN